MTPPARSGTKPKGGRGGRPRPVRIHRIGHRIGPALDQARRQYARREQGGGHGSSRGPHPRRAHWHTYWVGSGPKEQKTKILRWVHLILVKATIMDTATVVQVKG